MRMRSRSPGPLLSLSIWQFLFTSFDGTLVQGGNRVILTCIADDGATADEPPEPHADAYGRQGAPPHQSRSPGPLPHCLAC